MPIRLFCDICGKTMAVISIKDMQKYYQKHGERCGDCLKMEADLKIFVEKKKGHMLNRFEMLVKEMAELMSKEVNKLMIDRAKFEGLSDRVTPNEMEE